MIRQKDLLVKATKLRRLGKSYLQISQKLGVPKSTLSFWFSKNKWSQQLSRKLILKKREEDTNRLIKINKKRHILTLIRYDRFRTEATKSFPALSKNPLFLIGLSLYWGEGEKRDSGRVSVINTDVSLMKTVVNFYRKILKVSEDKLRVGLFIYADIDQDKAINFWARNLKISKKQFIKVQILPSRAKITKRKVKYGVCSVYLASTELNIKMRHWIYLLSGKIGISN